VVKQLKHQCKTPILPHTPRDIRKKTEGIQSSSETTVHTINEISEVIHNIDEMVPATATAVEQQSVTTKEIAGNVSQVFRGGQKVNENVAQNSQKTASISECIGGIKEIAEQVSDQSAQVTASTEEVAILGGQLRQLIGKLKV
jgi:methyl-accepting chemotaxis protein